jgi:transposase
MKENGYGPTEIVQATGCSRQSIYPLWNKWQNSKEREKRQVFCVQHRGTREGQYRTLTPEQERGIQKVIKDKYPDQLKLDFALWTREAVRLTIKQKYGIDMPIRTVGEYLKCWNFTPQRPVRYAYERDGEKVREWLENTKPDGEEGKHKHGIGDNEPGESILETTRGNYTARPFHPAEGTG